jgi:Domain of unknown function (DUF4913)
MTSPATTDGERDERLREADARPYFILYQSGSEFTDSLDRLAFWVHQLLIPVYGREVTSMAPWCPEWWRHPEAVAYLHGLFLAWESLTGAGSDRTGPAIWHRDFLGPTMLALRDPSGPLAGCRVGSHRDKRSPTVVDHKAAL